MACPDGEQRGLVIALLCVFFIGGFFTFGYLFKAGRQSPQSVRYLISMVARRMIIPSIDVILDIYSCASYFAEGNHAAGAAILVFLVVGQFAIGTMCAYVATNEYKGLTLERGSPIIVRGALAGFCNVGPLWLGWRAVGCWREITDSERWRKSSIAKTTQEQVESFIKMVADIKQCIQFESLYEGGPQLVVQLFLLVQGASELGAGLSCWQLKDVLRVLSPCFSAGYAQTLARTLSRTRCRVHAVARTLSHVHYRTFSLARSSTITSACAGAHIRKHAHPLLARRPSTTTPTPSVAPPPMAQRPHPLHPRLPLRE